MESLNTHHSAIQTRIAILHRVDNHVNAALAAKRVNMLSIAISQKALAIETALNAHDPSVFDWVAKRLKGIDTAPSRRR